MFFLNYGYRNTFKGFCFKKYKKYFSHSTKYIFIKANATCFGYKMIVIIRPELQDTKWGLTPAVSKLQISTFIIKMYIYCKKYIRSRVQKFPA